MERADGTLLRIEVVYCPRAGAADASELRLPAGTTLLQAVQASGVAERHPEIDLAHQRVGIWSRPSAPDTVLRDGDRVELYRPLTIDPKEARRRRQAAQGKTGRG